MASDTHLLIDGYNLIHCWPDLRRALDVGVESAQAALAAKVKAIHDVEGVRTTLVFDGRGERPQIERPGRLVTFSYLYSPSGFTADAMIEQLVETSRKPQNMVVVTRDTLLAQTVVSLGGLVLSPEGLLDWIERCEQRQKQQVDEVSKRTVRDWKKRGASPFDGL